jgi:hypothetical protein
MDSTIHTSTAEQRPVGGIHDGIHLQCGDVCHDNLQSLVHSPSNFLQSLCKQENDNPSASNARSVKIAAKLLKIRQNPFIQTTVWLLFADFSLSLPSNYH